MEDVLDNKINILKALAIMLVVSGHLGLSIIPFFPTYSFHIALFFFISGYLFKDKHISEIPRYIKAKAKRLLVPYFGYIVAYLGITLMVYKLTGIYYGRPISIINFITSPFVEGNQFYFLTTLWFIAQLFISLSVFILIFKCLKKLWDNKYFHLILFLILAILAIKISIYRANPTILVLLRTLLSMFFIYLGYFYKNFVEEKYNIFNSKWFGAIIILESILWFFNKSTEPRAGIAIGLDYLFSCGFFNNNVVPIITSITGIWASLFIVNIFYPYINDNKFIQQVGKNTYHIMANHLFIIYLLSNFFLWIKGLPISMRSYYSLFWVYSPSKTSYFYFIVVLIISTYIGVAISSINKNIPFLFSAIKKKESL